MASRKPLVVGNWKLNGSLAFSRQLVTALINATQLLKSADLVICPPFVYLRDVQRLLNDSHIQLGAQDMSDQLSGAFTGEVSATMLAEVGCSYVIIGHSERRKWYGESEILIADKFKAAQSQSLIPILCLGETPEQRDKGEHYDVVSAQLDCIRDNCQNTDFVIAYEPVWAIGTGRIASSDQISDMHRVIRRGLDDFLGDVASQVRVIYGGSIDADNALTLFNAEHVDGGLVGGASLNDKAFALIYQAACKISAAEDE